MSDLRVTTVQTKLYWEDREKNIKHLSALLGELKPGTTDLVILPEMFTSGFTMNASAVADTMYGTGPVFMKIMAADLKAVVCGSMVIRENNRYYNRLLWVTPKGKISHYDKRHLFRMAREEKTYSPGNSILDVKIRDWNIRPLVCYDLRFPVWCRSSGSTDLMLFVANWPARRKYAWNQLLVARAIENQCYVAGVNRTGTDGIGISYPGQTAVLDFMGNRISKTRAQSGKVETVTLKRQPLTHFRKSFPVFRDADRFKLVI